MCMHRSSDKLLDSICTGIVLAGFVAFPAWHHLIEHGYPCGILVLASLFAGLGIAWWTIVTSKNYPKRLPQRSKEKEIFC